jgi:hypothetical protein
METCAAKRALTRSGGAGSNLNSTPAPTRPYTRTINTLHLRQQLSTLATTERATDLALQRHTAAKCRVEMTDNNQIRKAFLKFKRTVICLSLHIWPSNVLLPPFKNREKHTDAP